MTAKAFHVIAAINLLDGDPAFGTPFELAEVGKEVVIAFFLVILHHAVGTKLHTAFPTTRRLFCQVNDAFLATLLGTEFDVWIVHGLTP